MNPAVAHARKEESNAPRVPLIPFTHAAHEHVEGIADTSDLVSTAVIQKGPFDIPAFGYIKNVYLIVTTSGGVNGTATAHEDAPFNVLQNVSLEDVNGAPIVGPIDGDELFLINKYGGYEFHGDPVDMPDFVGGACVFSFSLRIPVEINPRTGLGCLSNMNASANYKLRYSINLGTGADGIVTAIGTGTLPTVRVRSFLEAWSLPAAYSRDQAPQATEPPLLGTTQYWSKRIVNISAGEQTVALTRVGNQIRNLIVVFRNTTPARNDTNFPPTQRFNWDARMIFNEPVEYRRNRMSETFRFARGVRDTGVYVYGFHHDGNGHPGGEDDGHLWLRTVQNSRLEFVGTYGVAGTVVILTNDVAPVAVTDRYVEVSRTGGTPGASPSLVGS